MTPVINHALYVRDHNNRRLDLIGSRTFGQAVMQAPRGWTGISSCLEFSYCVRPTDCMHAAPAGTSI